LNSVRKAALMFSVINALMDYHLTWYKCCPHWDDVQWPWPWSITQRSRSHETFKCQSTHARVRAVTYVCIDGLPSNLVLIETMCSDIDPDPYLKGQGHRTH